jgi:hypothetical protein
MSGANLSSLARSPWTVANAVLAPGPCGQVGAQPAGGPHLLAVPQAFPSPCRLKICPPAVILMVALVRTPREVGYPVRRDQQSADARDDIPASVRQAVLAQVAVSHAPHDGGSLGECRLYWAIGVANGLLQRILTCRDEGADHPEARARSGCSVSGADALGCSPPARARSATRILGRQSVVGRG